MKDSSRGRRPRGPNPVWLWGNSSVRSVLSSFILDSIWRLIVDIPALVIPAGASALPDVGPPPASVGTWCGDRGGGLAEVRADRTRPPGRMTSVAVPIGDRSGSRGRP